MQTFRTFLYTHRIHFLVAICIIGFFVFEASSVLAQGTGAVGGPIPAETDDDLNFWKLDDWIARFVHGVAYVLGWIVLSISALLFDTSINYTIIQAGEKFSSTDTGGIGQVVRDLWVVIRDIFNILFIFGFIWIGIKTILFSEDSGTRRQIGLLLVAALLINFSLYITQVIVDFTNIAAIQIHNQIITGSVAGNDPQIDSADTPLGIVEGNTVAGGFLNVTKLTSLTQAETEGTDVKMWKVFAYSFFMFIFLCIAGMVLVYGSILLITRFVALIIYMILSPAMFLGWILPKFADKQSGWWRGFLNQAFFAPAFMFMLYLSLLVIQRLQGSVSFVDGGYSNIIVSGSDITDDKFSMVIFFCIAIGFLYASIKVGEKMGIAGASASVKMLNTMRGTAQGVLYRNTAGRGLNLAVKGIDSLDRSAEGGSRTAKFARTLIGGESARQVAVKGRDYGAGGTGYSSAEKMNKERSQRATRGNEIHNIGHAITHGTQIERERAIRGASSAQLTEMMHHGDEENIISVAGELSETQVKAIMDDKEIDDATKTKFAKARGEQIATRLKENNKIKRTDATGNVAEVEGEIQDVIGKADISELKALGFDEAIKHAGKLSAKQIEDWKDLTPTEKMQLKAERKKQHVEEFTDNPGEFFKRISSDEERSKLSDGILTSNKSVPYLNTNVLSKIVENNGITDSHRTQIKENIREYYGVTEETKDADKFKRFEEFFNKNNAGQRY